MPGARVGVFRDDGPPLWRRARADGSYASANDPRVLVGLGQADAVPRVRVVWPIGREEDWTDSAGGPVAHARRGHGREPGVTVEQKLSSGLVSVCLLLGAASANAAGGPRSVTVASLQAGQTEPTLLPVVLPDLGPRARVGPGAASRGVRGGDRGGGPGMAARPGASWAGS